MANNVEIKARLDDIAGAHELAKALADQPPVEIHQRDTFFKSSVGRLKLRDFLDGTGELIFYIREDSPDPVDSYYQLTPTADVQGLRRVLSESLGVRGEVEKVRFLYLSGRTRIHVDQVKHLGNFIELEVVLDEGGTESGGYAEAEEIMTRLSILPEHLVHRAYIDLLTDEQ